MKNDNEKVDSREIAMLLFKEYIISTKYEKFILLKDLKEKSKNRFYNKMFLYQEALVFMGIYALSEKNDNYLKISKMLEKVIKQETKILELRFAEQIEETMQSLDELLFIEDTSKIFDWAIIWLKDIEIIETDPEKLFEFIKFWQTTYLSIVKLLEKKDIK